MLCESCRQQSATVHMTTIVGGEKIEQHLCAACCQKQKQAMTVAGMNALLASFLQAEQSTASSLRCPACGQTYEQFRKSGTLGCARCYEEFRAHLKPMLERIHGRVQHAGRVPKQADELNRARRKLEELRRDMERAIASEDFERAAVLRDEMRAMQPAREGEAHG